MATEKSFDELFPEFANAYSSTEEPVEEPVEEIAEITGGEPAEKSFDELFPEFAGAYDSGLVEETTETTETTLKDFDPRGADWGGAFVYGLTFRKHGYYTRSFRS